MTTARSMGAGRASWLTALLALVPATAWAGKDEHVDFTKARLGSYAKSPCSPTPEPKAKQGILFNMPKQVEWGAPLPICGLVRTTAERKQPLVVRIWIDFAQPRAHNQQLMGVLVQEGRAQAAGDGALLYFNLDGLAPTAWASLAPGDYQVTLDADSGALTGPTRPLRVVSGGWRKELAAALVVRTCTGNLLEDLAPYFKYLSILSIERPASGEAAEASLASLREKWHRGFGPHAAMLTPRIREGLGSTTKSDPALSEHTWRGTRQQCPKRSPDEAGRLEDVILAIQQYEIAAER